MLLPVRSSLLVLRLGEKDVRRLLVCDLLDKQRRREMWRLRRADSRLSALIQSVENLHKYPL